jgi:hypothetical protein
MDISFSNLRKLARSPETKLIIIQQQSFNAGPIPLIADNASIA